MRTGSGASRSCGFGRRGLRATQLALAGLQVGLHKAAQETEEVMIQQMHLLNLCSTAHYAVIIAVMPTCEQSCDG